MKILLAGGGSGGPVSPVLAVALEIKKNQPNTEILFVGTKKGPERIMVVEAGIDFVSIPTAKLRRYFSPYNFSVPFALAAALVSAMRIVRKFRPDIVFSAGSFVAVPVAWAARMHGAKIIIHQQDARIGLANKLISPFASEITTAFEQTSKEFYAGSGMDNAKWHPAIWTGNPVRSDLLNATTSAKKYFNLHDELPILLVLGGATGAAQINSLIAKILSDLVTVHQVVHQTGKGKSNIDFKHKNYHSMELLPFDIYSSILKLAHLVIARAGLSTIAELSALHKPSIIIPMPLTHQEENAKILLDAHAAVVLMNSEVTAENLQKVINSLKFNKKRVEMLKNNMGKLMPKDAAIKIAQIILKYE